MRILNQLIGRYIGAGPANHNTGLPGPMISHGGLRLGDHGSQFSFPHPRRVVLLDDFLGDVVADQWNLLEGTDSATTDAAIISGGIGGVLRLTSGDAGTGLAADLVEMTQTLNWQASNGGLEIEARLKLSRITNAYAFFGFTDLAASLEAPIVSAASADTLTTNASDAVGWMFDTRMAADNWWLTGVAADIDATAQNSGYAPVADTYEVLRIEVNSSGVATFFRNGKQVGTPMSGALTPATDLTPVLALGNTSGTSSFTMDVDYFYVGMDRGAAGAST